MLVFLTVIHVIICILLVFIILIQQGRGGGLVEMASGMESIFGTKTSSFITRATGVLAAAFLVSSLVIAFLSARRSRSLMESIAVESAPVESAPLESTQQLRPTTESSGAADISQTQSPSQKEIPAQENSPLPGGVEEAVQEDELRTDSESQASVPVQTEQ